MENIHAALAPFAAAVEEQSETGGLFDLVTGLPVHPLVVHLPVVALPAAALLILAMAIVPRWRRRLGVATWIVLLVGTLGVFVALESGEALAGRVGSPGEHAQWGQALMVVSLLAVVLVGLWVLVESRSRWSAVHGDRAASGAPNDAGSSAARPRSSALSVTLAIASAVAAIGLLVTAIGAGHTGAQAAWGEEIAAEESAAGASAAPSQTTNVAATYTMEDVTQRNTAESCWSVVDGTVYDLTDWVSQHPGGEERILNMCGIDATAAFQAQHGGGSPVATLERYAIGELEG